MLCFPCNFMTVDLPNDCFRTPLTCVNIKLIFESCTIYLVSSFCQFLALVHIDTALDIVTFLVGSLDDIDMRGNLLTGHPEGANAG